MAASTRRSCSSVSAGSVFQKIWFTRPSLPITSSTGTPTGAEAAVDSRPGAALGANLPGEPGCAAGGRTAGAVTVAGAGTGTGIATGAGYFFTRTDWSGFFSIATSAPGAMGATPRSITVRTA